MAYQTSTVVVDTPLGATQSKPKPASLERWLPIVLLAALIAFHTVGNILWLRQDSRSLFGDPGNHARVSLAIFDILRHPTPDILSRIGDATTYWPPLVYLFSQPLYAVAGIGTDVTNFTITVFLALLIVFTYLLGKRLYGVKAGLLAAFLVSFYPIVTMLSRIYYLDLSLAALVTITFYLLACSDAFRHRGYALLFGVSLALTALTKQGFFILVVGPIGFAVGIALLSNGKAGWRELFAWRPGHHMSPHGADLANRLLNLLLAGLLAMAIALPWYLTNLSLLTWQSKILVGEAERQFVGKPYWWYLVKFDDMLLIWPWLLFLVGLITAILHPKRHWLPLVWFISTSLLFPLINRDHIRYMLPIMPAVALLSAQWITVLPRLAVRRTLIGVTVAFQVTAYVLMSWGAPKSWNQALHVPVQNESLPFANLTADRPLVIDPLAFLYFQYPPGPHRWPVQSILDRVYADIEEDQRTDEFSRLTLLTKIPDFEFSTFFYETELARRSAQPAARNLAVDDVGSDDDFVVDFLDTEYALYKSGYFGVPGARRNLPAMHESWRRGDEALHSRFSVVDRWELQDGSYAELLKRNGPPLAGLSPQQLRPMVQYALSVTPQSKKAQRLQAQLAVKTHSPVTISQAIELWQDEVRFDPNNRPAWRRLIDALLEAGQGEAALEAIEVASKRPALANATLVELATQRARVLDVLGRVDAAREAHQAALNLAPTNAEANLAMGVFLLRHAQAEQAQPYFDAGRQATSDPAGFLVNLASVYVEAGQDEKAIANLQEALALDRQQRSAFVLMASIYRSQGDYAEAIRILEEGMTQWTPEAEDLILLGDLYRETQNAERTRVVYQSALDQYSDDPAGYLALGRYLFDTGDPAGALAVYQAGLAAIPDDLVLLDALAQLGTQNQTALDTVLGVLADQDASDPDSYISLSQVQLKAGNSTGAETILRKGVQQVAQPASLWVELAKLYASLGRTDEAEAAMQEAVAAAPSDAKIYLEQAAFYENLVKNAGASDAKRYWTAIRDAYRHALDLSPTLVRAYTGLGQYYRVQQDYTAAAEIYKRGLAFVPDHPWVTFGLAQTYKEAGDHEASLPYYEKVVQIEPNNALFVYEVAKAYGRLLRWPEAVESYREALRLKPEYAGDPSFMSSLGLAELNRGDPQAAAEVFRSTVELGPDNWAARFYLGQALEAAGKLDEARRAYQRLVDQAPTSDFGKKASERLQALGK